MSSKSVLQECQVRSVKLNATQESQVRVSSKKCLTRVSSKNAPEEVSRKSVLQECQVRSVLQKCQVRAFYPEECQVRVSQKSVK